MIRKIADLNHRFVFKLWSTFWSFITDLVPFAFADLFLWLYQWPMIAIAMIVIYMPYFYYSQVRNLFVETDQVSSVFYISLVMIAVLLILPSFRTSYVEKLGITRQKVETDSRIAFLCERLKHLSIPAESTIELNSRILMEVKLFTRKMDGYDFRSPTRVKKSLFSRAVATRMQMGGMFNLITPEIVTMDIEWLEVTSHEAFHSRGHIKESHVVFYSILALLLSKDPSIQYWGYLIWLNHLLEFKSDTTEGWSKKVFLEQSDLKDESIQMILGHGTHRDELAKKRADALSDNKVPVIYRIGIFFLLLPIVVVYLFRQLILKLMNQGDTASAYQNEPLEYLEGYLLKYLL